MKLNDAEAIRRNPIPWKRRS